MGVFNLNGLPKEKRIQMIGEFYDVINSLKNRSEVRLFFKDLLTPNEIAMLMRRLEVAVLLESGFTYDKISELLNTGRAKTANIHKILLMDGSGYKIAVKRLLEDRKKRIKKIREKEIDPLTFKAATKKYPYHFLLFNLISELGISLKNDPEKEKEAALFTPSLSILRKKQK